MTTSWTNRVVSAIVEDKIKSKDNQVLGLYGLFHRCDSMGYAPRSYSGDRLDFNGKIKENT